VKFEIYTTFYSQNEFSRYKSPRHIASVDYILLSTCSISEYINDSVLEKNFKNKLEYCEDNIYNESSHWLFQDFFRCCQILQALSIHKFYDDIRERKHVYIKPIENSLNNTLFDSKKDIGDIEQDFSLHEGFEFSESEGIYRNNNGKNPLSYYSLSTAGKFVRIQTSSEQKVREYMQEPSSQIQYYSNDNNGNINNIDVTDNNVNKQDNNPYLNYTNNNNPEKKEFYVYKKPINQFSYNSQILNSGSRGDTNNAEFIKHYNRLIANEIDTKSTKKLNINPYHAENMQQRDWVFCNHGILI
jgi:hypothetical protein